MDQKQWAASKIQCMKCFWSEIKDFLLNKPSHVLCCTTTPYWVLEPFLQSVEPLLKFPSLFRSRFFLWNTEIKTSWSHWSADEELLHFPRIFVFQMLRFCIIDHGSSILMAQVLCWPIRAQVIFLYVQTVLFVWTCRCVVMHVVFVSLFLCQISALNTVKYSQWIHMQSLLGHNLQTQRRLQTRGLSRSRKQRFTAT